MKHKIIFGYRYCVVRHIFHSEWFVLYTFVIGWNHYWVNALFHKVYNIYDNEDAAIQDCDVLNQD